MNRALRAATTVVLLVSPVALAACSAGQVTQTATQVRDKVGAMAQVGELTIRAVQGALPVYARALEAGTVDSLLHGRPVAPALRERAEPRRLGSRTAANGGNKGGTA